MQDTNAILITFLQTQTTLGALIGYSAPVINPPAPGTPARIYCPRVPDVGVLPCISLFRRGGPADKYIPPKQTVSFQIDCWANDSVTSDEIYGALEDCLQDIKNASVTVGADSYLIASSSKETEPQTLQDIDIPTRFRTMGFFQLVIKNH